MARESKLTNEVYASLLHQIASGEISVGSKLPTEAELAQTYSVSRFVIRGAITQLRSHGYIETIRGSGSFVTKPKDKPEPSPREYIFQPCTDTQFEMHGLADVLLINEIRMLFEGELAALAALRWDEKDMEAIEAAYYGAIDGEKDHDEALRYEMDFHYSIIKASKNAFGVACYNWMKPYLLVGTNLNHQLHLMLPKLSHKKVLKEHKTILKALHARDAEAARKAMCEHIAIFHSDIEHTKDAVDFKKSS
ncbi:FadR family transcriptional regulator [Rhodobacteraceae bacterium RKSG542]|uniref:FadR/GntR family transcriptional regulator n=1 Tax=Pseudovibrio flavus TaxID=2529854 RepID=UPI0012BC8430|nr:FadR/GntR family transcriptional regulator [Pseudovibrio flavus]MTI17751.1 FadR family transcriptional regulator [Pseudovibrio flavus]